MNDPATHCKVKFPVEECPDAQMGVQVDPLDTVDTQEVEYINAEVSSGRVQGSGSQTPAAGPSTPRLHCRLKLSVAVKPAKHEGIQTSLLGMVVGHDAWVYKVERVLFGRVHGSGSHTPAGVDNDPRVQIICSKADAVYPGLQVGVQASPWFNSVPQDTLYTVDEVSLGTSQGSGRQEPEPPIHVPSTHINPRLAASGIGEWPDTQTGWHTVPLMVVASQTDEYTVVAVSEGRSHGNAS